MEGYADVYHEKVIHDVVEDCEAEVGLNAEGQDQWNRQHLDEDEDHADDVPDHAFGLFRVPHGEEIREHSPQDGRPCVDS